MKIIAEIKPVALARTRVNTSNKGRYLPSATSRFKRELGALAKAQMKGRKIFDKPLKVTIRFYKPVKVDSRPYGDVDNLVKAVLDALNGVVWTDDALIVQLTAFKIRSTSKIEIEIEEVAP